jgi:hypothetical protein
MNFYFAEKINNGTIYLAMLIKLLMPQHHKHSTPFILQENSVPFKDIQKHLNNIVTTLMDGTWCCRRQDMMLMASQVTRSNTI